jgi:hypothetical protein
VLLFPNDGDRTMNTYVHAIHNRFQIDLTYLINRTHALAHISTSAESIPGMIVSS